MKGKILSEIVAVVPDKYTQKPSISKHCTTPLRYKIPYKETIVQPVTAIPERIAIARRRTEYDKILLQINGLSAYKIGIEGKRPDAIYGALRTRILRQHLPLRIRVRGSFVYLQVLPKQLNKYIKKQREISARYQLKSCV